MARLGIVLVAALAGGCHRSADDWPESCPDPDDSGVWYANESWALREQCSGPMGDIACTPPLETFGPDDPDYGDCGCGCVPPGYER